MNDGVSTRNSILLSQSHPDISVIIQSYKRPKYLLEAIKSVIAQKTNCKFELIVVKNYEDDEIDSLLTLTGATNVLSKDNTFPGKIKEGLDCAKGEVISFLDDDDLFEPNKLNIVFNEFKENSKLIYYHNFFNEIDETGRIRPPKLMKAGRGDILVDTSDLRNAHRKELYEFYSFYNTSAISVRRTAFIKVISKHPEFQTTPVDMNIFFACCDSRMDLKISTKKLNLYRIHKQNVTFNQNFNEKVAKYKSDLQEFKRQEDVSKGSFIFPLLRARRLDTQFILYFMSESERRPRLKDLLLYTYYSFKRRNRMKLIMILLLYSGLLNRRRLSEMDEERVRKRNSFD